MAETAALVTGVLMKGRNLGKQDADLLKPTKIALIRCPIRELSNGDVFKTWRGRRLSAAVRLPTGLVLPVR